MADSNTLLIKEYSIVLTALGLISTIMAQGKDTSTLSSLCPGSGTYYRD